MKKVLHLTLYLDIGGLERVVFLLCREQRKAGWEPSVVAYGKANGDLEPQFRSEKIPVAFLGKGPGFSPLLPFRIVRHAKSNGITLIHSHDLGALLYASLARLLSFGRIKIVHTQHSFQHLNGWKMRLYEKIFPRFAGKIVCVSENLRKTYLELGHSPERLLVILNGVDFSLPEATKASRAAAKRSLCAKHGLPPAIADRRWVITLGRLAPVKGPQHALKLWSESKTAEAALLLVGPEAEPGFLAKLRASAPAHTFFPGATLEPQAWLAAADLFLSCSEFEGMPLAALEAAAQKLPMILSGIPGHSIFEGWAALFPPENSQLGSNALGTFLATGSTGGETGKRETLERLERDCGATGMSGKYLEVYEEVEK